MSNFKLKVRRLGDSDSNSNLQYRKVGGTVTPPCRTVSKVPDGVSSSTATARPPQQHMRSHGRAAATGSGPPLTAGQ
jgi:hypothetical protein